MKELHELDTMTLKSLFNRLTRIHILKDVEIEFGVVIPQWLTIIYRCESCNENSRMKIQATAIRGVNKYLPCPTCRQSTHAFTLHN